MDFEKYFKKGFWDNSKNIYICGIDTVSFGLIKYLQEKEQTNIYFIDEGFDGAMELWGMVAYPISIISEEVLQTPFFLVTDPNQSRRNKYIKMIRKHYGTNCMKEIYNATEIRIDVSGICNLRCPSCQVGNHGLQDFVYKNRGFMDESSFQKILKKIALPSGWICQNRTAAAGRNTAAYNCNRSEAVGGILGRDTGMDDRRGLLWTVDWKACRISPAGCCPYCAGDCCAGADGSDMSQADAI